MNILQNVRSLNRKPKSVLILLSVLFFLGFGYTQIYSFSGAIQTVENKEAVEIIAAREHRINDDSEQFNKVEDVSLFLSAIDI